MSNTLETEEETRNLVVGIVSSEEHAKSLVRQINKLGGFTPVLLGGDGVGSLPTSLDVLLCRPASCSHKATDKVLEAKRSNAYPHVLIESGNSTVINYLRQIKLGAKEVEIRSTNQGNNTTMPQSQLETDGGNYQSAIRKVIREVGFFHPNMVKAPGSRPLVKHIKLFIDLSKTAGVFRGNEQDLQRTLTALGGANREGMRRAIQAIHKSFYEIELTPTRGGHPYTLLLWNEGTLDSEDIGALALMLGYRNPNVSDTDTVVPTSTSTPAVSSAKPLPIKRESLRVGSFSAYHRNGQTWQIFQRGKKNQYKCQITGADEAVLSKMQELEDELVQANAASHESSISDSSISDSSISDSSISDSSISDSSISDSSISDSSISDEPTLVDHKTESVAAESVVEPVAVEPVAAETVVAAPSSRTAPSSPEDELKTLLEMLEDQLVKMGIRGSLIKHGSLSINVLPTHLNWQGKAACFGLVGAPPDALKHPSTLKLSSVNCSACQASDSYKLAEWVLENVKA